METLCPTRDYMLHIRVTKKEKELIEQKMAQVNINSREAYLRKMAIDGYIVKIDIPEIREFITQIRRYGNNLNQMAKQANEYGSIYQADLQTLQAYHDRLFSLASEILHRLSEI